MLNICIGGTLGQADSLAIARDRAKMSSCFEDFLEKIERYKSLRLDLSLSLSQYKSQELIQLQEELN